MRKVFSVLPLLILFLLVPSNVLATSGCCSGHGGVSCASGAQANGHVICNDGWRGSSCSYSSMVMCGGSTTTTTVTYTAPPAVITPKPTAKPTVKPSTPSPEPTIASTNSPSPSPTETPTAEPEVKGESVEQTPEPTPPPSPEPLTAGKTVTALSTTGGVAWAGWKFLKWLGKKAASTI